MYCYRHLFRVFTIKRISFGIYTINGHCISCYEPIDMDNIESLYSLYAKIEQYPLHFRIGRDKLFARNSKKHLTVRPVEDSRLEISLSTPTFDGTGKYHSNTKHYNIHKRKLVQFVKEHVI